MANIKQTVKLGVFTLAIMNVTAVVSLLSLIHIYGGYGDTVPSIFVSCAMFNPSIKTLRL